MIQPFCQKLKILNPNLKKTYFNILVFYLLLIIIHIQYIIANSIKAALTYRNREQIVCLEQKMGKRRPSKHFGSDEK